MKRLFQKVFIFISLFGGELLFSENVAGDLRQMGRPKPPTFLDFLFQPKFLVMLGIGLIALILLKTRTMKKGRKMTLLLISTFLFGFAGNIPARFFHSFIMHPSPICAATKSILYGFGIPLIVTLAVIFFLTLIGPKLFCGYVCPVGTSQELIAMLSDRLKIKRGHTNFTLAYGVRLGIFLLFVFVSGTAILNTVVDGVTYPLSLYDYFNPFHGMELGPDPNLLGYAIHYLPFLLTLIFAFKYYRPFCHFVCPVGLYTHFIEQFSLFRVTLDKKTCSDCNTCLKDYPCSAIPEIMKEATLRPDCFACGVCTQDCVQKSFSIGICRTKN